ncbi:hypothetical protein GJ496_007392, partial [Pomphorhynchus laevis]
PVLTNNPLVIIFQARYHIAQQSSTLLALRTLMCYMDALIESNVESARNGLIFIIDMNGSTFENFDYMLSHKLLKLVKIICTVRIRAVYVVAPPTWFNPIFKVSYLDNAQMREVLENILPSNYLPGYTFASDNSNYTNNSVDRQVNGGYKYKFEEDIDAWPTECLRILNYSKNLFLQKHYKSHRPPGYLLSKEERRAKQHNTLGSLKCIYGKIALAQLSFVNEQIEDSETKSQKLFVPQTFYMSNVQLVTVRNFISRITQRNIWSQLEAEYKSVESFSDASFEERDLLSFKDRVNSRRNRYPDIVCLDATRVVLRESLDGNDYVHANFVDGASHPRGYISTQGPLKSTFGDFWQMVWEQHIHIIVMVTKINENNVFKCGQYWPPTVNLTMQISDTITIRNNTVESEMDKFKVMCGVQNFDDFQVTILQIENTNSSSNKNKKMNSRQRFKARMPQSASNNDTMEHSVMSKRSSTDINSVFNMSSSSNRSRGSSSICSRSFDGDNDQNNSSSIRTVYHFQFNGWPDHGVPQNPDNLLNMRSAINRLQAYLVNADDSWCGHPLGPPIIVHCSAGIGRTGTFCIIDICLTSLEQSILTQYCNGNRKRNNSKSPSKNSKQSNSMSKDNDVLCDSISINQQRSNMIIPNTASNELDSTMLSVPEVLLAVRSQRAYSVQNSRQYAFCYESMFRYITTYLSRSTIESIMKYISHEVTASSL